MEQFKEIPGWPGYLVSSQGYVLSLKRAEPKKLKLCFNEDGYLHAGLSRPGKIKTFKIQKLVAEAFLGPRPDGMQSCHNDGNKLNNDVSNLRWDTPSSNTKDIYLHGHGNPPRGSMNGMSKLTEKDVKDIRELYTPGQISHGEIAQVYGVSREQIRDIVNRKYWQHV